LLKCKAAFTSPVKAAAGKRTFAKLAKVSLALVHGAGATGAMPVLTTAPQQLAAAEATPLWRGARLAPERKP